MPDFAAAVPVYRAYIMRVYVYIGMYASVVGNVHKSYIYSI